MIARVWKGLAKPENAEAYYRFVTSDVLPSLGRIDGHAGAHVMRRTVDGQVEFVVLTLWRSMEAVRAFAGDDPEVAVVEAEARAVLSEFDLFVRHYELVYSTPA